LLSRPAETNGLDIYEDIRTALFQDNATAGEAAGYAMGLVMLGSASEKALEEMLSYARETQHEKIIRSLAVGLALVMYRQREGADALIKELSEEKVSWVVCAVERF
jgi:26S proteasome regulatory subunit N2